MERLSTDKYQELLNNAIQHFWKTRYSQGIKQKNTDQGNRGAVTGGKQLDGFIDIFVQISLDIGIPKSCIFRRGNNLPGFFRPTKDWDFIIVSPDNKLITAIEFKSQVGSFGNNFNNKTEEALGSAVDLWTAFREQTFPQKQQPWVGYLMIVEKTVKSTRPIRLMEPYFKVRPEFQNSSYLERYCLFCQKLMQERHYNSTALIWSNKEMEFGNLEDDISFDSFVLSFMGFLQGKLNDFDL